MHPVYDPNYLAAVKPIHRPPVKARWLPPCRPPALPACRPLTQAPSPPRLLQLHEKAGYYAVQALRRGFDWASG